MTILKLISGREYVLEDNEAEYLISVIEKGIKFIRLSNGDFMAASSISVIGEPEKVPFWGGYILNSDEKSFQKNGERIYLETENFKEIEYRENPKYSHITNVKLLK